MPPPPPPSKQASARDLRHRILTCLNRLTDRDTLSLACTELESIIPNLTPETFSLFITSVSSTTSADRSTVRVASLRLLSSLATAHRTSLSPHLPKLVTAIVRRLRDLDSSVRSACASTCSSLVSNIAYDPSSLSSILRPLSDALSTEQEPSAQSAAAMCLSASVDSASPEAQPEQIGKNMLGKWMRLLRCDSFKAKSSLLTLIRSAIRVSNIGNSSTLLSDMIGTLLEFTKSEDWGTRKASAEALTELAVVERDALSEYKVSCLKTFESRRFDKVKAVRDAMNLMVDAWKDIPDILDEKSPPPRSQASSKDNESYNRRRPPPRSSRSSHIVESNTPRTNSKRTVPLSRKSPASSTDGASKTTAGSRAAVGDSRRRRLGPASTFRKLDFNKSADRRPAGISGHRSSSVVAPVWEESEPVEEEKQRCRSSQGDDADGKKSASDDCCRHQQHINKDCEEDLSSIRKQLVQIDAQQSSLMDLLQKFIGSSQDGMRLLESRVNGLEVALGNMSYDLAVSATRMAKSEHITPNRNSSCCLQFWRRSETRRFSIPGTAPPSSIIRNPLAEVQVSTTSGGGRASSSVNSLAKNVHTRRAV